MDYVDNYSDETPTQAEEPTPEVVAESAGEAVEEPPVADDPAASFFDQ